MGLNNQAYIIFPELQPYLSLWLIFVSFVQFIHTITSQNWWISVFLSCPWVATQAHEVQSSRMTASCLLLIQTPHLTLYPCNSSEVSVQQSVSNSPL